MNSTNTHYNNIVDVFENASDNDSNFLNSLEDIKILLKYIKTIQLVEIETKEFINIRPCYNFEDRESFRLEIDSNLKLIESLNKYFLIETPVNGSYFLKLL